MLPTTNLRTDIISVKNPEWKILKIPLTKDQYMGIFEKKQKSSRTDTLIITDADTWDKLFHGEYGDIKGFEDIKWKDTSNLYWICDYWTSHAMQSWCECVKTFKVNPWSFRRTANEMFWKKFEETENLESGRIRTRTSFSPVYVQDLRWEQKLEIVRKLRT